MIKPPDFCPDVSTEIVRIGQHLAVCKRCRRELEKLVAHLPPMARLLITPERMDQFLNHLSTLEGHYHGKRAAD
jgi:hypothetical protein